MAAATRSSWTPPRQFERIRTDRIGPGQTFAVTAIQTCSQIMSRGNSVTIRWVPAHQGIAGNKKADEFAKAAAKQNTPDCAVSNELRWEISLSHMTRIATENRSRKVKVWVADHLGDPRRKCKPPKGKGVRRKLLQRAPKNIASRYYQLLSGHAAIGTCLKDKIRKTDDDQCSWCLSGKRQTRHHLFTECKA